MDDKDFLEHLGGISKNWNEAEKWLKKVEFLQNNAPLIPSINELRYAGRRVMDAYSDYTNKNYEQAKIHFHDANQAIEKAKFDVVDATFSFVKDYFNEINKRYGEPRTYKYFENYGKFLKLIDDTEEKIANSREDRNTRNEQYKKLINNLPTLLEYWKELKSIVPTIKKAKIIEFSRIYLLPIAITVATIILTKILL